MMRRRPLLRTAAIGGVAYAGAKAGTNKAMQQAEPQAQPAQPTQAPTPAAAPVQGASDRISQLQQLASLHDSGALTDEEFAREKTRILG